MKRKEAKEEWEDDTIDYSHFIVIGTFADGTWECIPVCPETASPEDLKDMKCEWGGCPRCLPKKKQRTQK